MPKNRQYGAINLGCRADHFCACKCGFIYRQLFAGNVVGSWPMERKEKIHGMIVLFI